MSKQSPEKASTKTGRPSLLWCVHALGILIVLAGLTFLAIAVSRAREEVKRACVPCHLYSLRLRLMMYADESEGGLYPPLAPYKGVWMFDIQALAEWDSHILESPQLLVNPRHPNADEQENRLRELFGQSPIDWETVHQIAAQGFTYPGWVLKSDADVEALQEHLAKSDPSVLHDDIRLADRTIYRLRKGIERIFISDINNPAAVEQALSEIPILFENVKTATDNDFTDCCVFFMDEDDYGFIPIGEEFPITETVKRAFPPPP